MLCEAKTSIEENKNKHFPSSFLLFELSIKVAGRLIHQFRYVHLVVVALRDVSFSY